MTNPRHGELDFRLARILGEYLEAHPVAKGYTNAGFILARDPDVARAPDLALVTLDRIAAKPPPARGFWELAPDLAVEIVSPDDRADDVMEKVGEYRQAGVKLVWVVYPSQRQVYVHHLSGEVDVLLEQGELTAPDLLPGFALSLSRLW